MPVDGKPDKLFLGKEVEKIRVDIRAEIDDAHSNLFDFLVVPVCADSEACEEAHANQGEPKGAESNEPDCGHDELEYELVPATKTDLILDNKIWSSSIVGALSSWIRPDDKNRSDAMRRLSADAMTKQLQWGIHCGMYALICPTPDVECANYASVLRGFSHTAAATHLWVRIPLVWTPPAHSSKGRASAAADAEGTGKSNEKAASSRAGGGESSDATTTTTGAAVDGWTVWNNVRLMCDHSPLISVALEFTDIPSSMANLDFTRWLAEPVKCVILPTSLFLANRKGWPVLPVSLKQLLQNLFRRRVQVVIRQNDAPAEFPPLGLSKDEEGSFLPGGERSIQHYVNYVAKLFQALPELSEAELFEHAYRDYLQIPLQPLYEDLESQTYEVFEKDPVKYVQYEAAVRTALQDRIAEGHKRHVLMVVGAGRGPLVQAALNALKTLQIEQPACSVYAVEKNPNAVVTLRGRVATDPDPAWRTVTVVGGDMRSYQHAEGVDILISELLGSFGDNELSPECLDGAQRFLSPSGVSIPSSYRSYLEPISTPKLWTECRGSSEGPKALATPYVVCIFEAYHLAREGPQQCFEFRHPNTRLHSNRRYREISFTAKADSMLHGFAGYFHCTLYKDVCISIEPKTFSTGMFSWFPLFLPISVPMLLKEGDNFKLHIWRQTDSQRVWYEWLVKTPSLYTTVHNSKGKSSWIGK
eukprot:GHVU01223240.1.p1 GENE.GHVU01223240.1~~GHVU01223240.1.p1  ORF type:complete len:718 (+),score=104.90 GHVU01223240.1:53-2155(+)